MSKLPINEINLNFLTPELKQYISSNFKMKMPLYNYLKNQELFCKEKYQLVVLSMGIGQDSMTILLKIIFDKNFREKYVPCGLKSLLVLFANTSSEHHYTYSYRERVLIPLCKKYNINFVSIEPQMGYHKPYWLSLRQQWAKDTPSIGSLAFTKFMNCSHQLKQEPQYKYVEDYIAKEFDIVPGTRKSNYKRFVEKYSKVSFLIGIAKDEESRIFNSSTEKHKWKKNSIYTRYPLIDIGYSRQKCQDYIKSTGTEIPFPSSCLYCCYGSFGLELLFLYYTYPDDFYKWAKDEQRKLDAYANSEKKNLGVIGKLHTKGENKGKAITLLDALEEAKQKYQGITLDEINAFKFSHGCTNSTF